MVMGPGHGSNNILTATTLSMRTHKEGTLGLVLSHVYSKQPIFGLTQEWFTELFFSRLEFGLHKRLHI